MTNLLEERNPVKDQKGKPSAINQKSNVFWQNQSIYSIYFAMNMVMVIVAISTSHSQRKIIFESDKVWFVGSVFVPIFHNVGCLIGNSCG